MKRSGLFLTAVLLSLSAGAYASGTAFDQDISDVLGAVDTLKAPPQGGFGDHGGGGQHPGQGGDHQPGGGFDNHGGHNIPQPPAPQPVHDDHPGQDGHHGNPGHDNNHPGPQPWNPNPGWDNNHGHNGWDNNHGNGPDWNHNHPQPPYNGPTYECSDWTFKSDTPNPFTDKIYFNDGQGRMQSQKVTINIGARDIKPWESEIITVCPGSLSQDKSLFNYSVAQKDTSGFGSFFTGEKSYEYTLTPTGRKASAPDSQGLVMAFGGASPDGKVYMTLTDKWAQFYQGQQLTLNVKIMRVPNAASLAGMSTQELLEALKETTFTVTYPVSGQYSVQLFDKAMAGTYMVTVDYVRDGSNVSQLFTLTI